MDRLWLDAPLPALCVRPAAGAAAIVANEAARRWAREHGVSEQALHELARATPPSGPVALAGRAGALVLDCRRIELDDGFLLWLDGSAVDAASTQRALAFLDRALVLSGVSVWRVDLAAHRIFFNAVTFHVLGMTEDPNGIELDYMRSTIHPDDRDAIVQAADEALAGNGVVDALARYRNADGSWRTLLTRRIAERDSHGRAIGLAGVSIDLTRQFDERDRAEVLDERTRLVVRALGVGFSTRDIDNDEALWDGQMCRIYGIDPNGAPFTGSQWLRLCVHAQDRERMAQGIREADARGVEVVETEFRMPDRDGQERWAHCWVRRMVRGGRRMAYGMHMDVTERKRAEALLLQRQRLVQAEREKSEFMARMSHELRTPMNAVLGFTQLLRDDPVQPPGERQRERLARIADAGAEMMRLVDSLLVLARRQPGQASLPPHDPARALHVLCVEDNPVNLQLVRELMALRPGVRLSTAIDGRSGIACACAEPPDLVLLDLQLPDMGGLEVLRRLRAETALAHSRIVALSADAMPGHIEAALAAGFDDYWTKPIQFDRFLAGIDGLEAELRR